MATEKVGIYRKYHGPIPTDKTGKPLPKSEWLRKRAFRWAVRWFGSDGKRYSKSCKTRKEAERFAEIKQTDIRSGKADPPPAITLTGFKAEHEQVMRGQVAHRTLDDQKRALRMFMEHVGKKIGLQNISPRHAESFIAARLASGVEASTANKDIRTLKRIFNLAIEPRGYLLAGTNPFEKIKPRKMTEKPIRYLSLKEYRALMNKAKDDSWWRALISVAYGSGLRRGEILNLTWADVNFESQRIRVAPKKETETTLEWEPKDHENRVLPVPEEAMQLLADLQADSVEGIPYVFLPAWRWRYMQLMRREGQWNKSQDLMNNFGRNFHKLRNKAGVAECTLHDLRRSCITNWAKVLPVYVVQKLAGHSDIKTTQKYYLAFQESDLEMARQAQSKILKSNPTDPKLTHSGQNQDSRKKLPNISA